MQWFRLYNEFAHDPKVQSLSEAMQRRLIMLFCFQSENVLQTLSDKQISYAMRISEKEWQRTKKNFQELMFIDSELNILNWEKRQAKSDNVNERVKRFRINKLKKECNVTETLRDGYTDDECNVTETLQKRHSNGLDKNRLDKIREDTKVDRSSSSTDLTTRTELLTMMEPKFPSIMFQGAVNAKVFRMLNDWENEKVITDDLKQAMIYVASLNVDVTSPTYYHRVVLDFAKCRIKNGNYEEVKKLCNNPKSNNFDWDEHNRKVMAAAFPDDPQYAAK